MRKLSASIPSVISMSSTLRLFIPFSLIELLLNIYLLQILQSQVFVLALPPPGMLLINAQIPLLDILQ